MPKGQPSANDVAMYILEKLGSMSTMKLQKLVYYSAAYSAAWLDRPLFSDRIEAWAYGPVVRSVYQLHRRRYSVDAERFRESAERFDLEPSSANLRKADIMVVDSVLNAFGELSGLELSDKTHQEAPWKDASESGWNRPITFETLKSFYSSGDLD